MKRIYPHNEPFGEGNGWHDCLPKTATLWLVQDRGPQGQWKEDQAFGSHKSAVDYLQSLEAPE